MLIVGSAAAVAQYAQRHSIVNYMTLDTPEGVDLVEPPAKVQWLADPGLPPEVVAAIEERLHEKGVL